ncbi:MAG TPA: class I SAM-dependent methyltransferase [Candidatus Saccharimonadales bacterium]|nr:class I SAM-dependent methyltransferase [Candidatus Saccharimonadales bacterium]
MGSAQNPDTRGYFDAFASMHDRYADEADWPAKADYLIGMAMGLKRAGTIEAALDLGAGTGISIAAIKHHARPSRIVAVDVSSKMLAELRGKRGYGEVETVNTDIADYVDGCEEEFDIVTSMGALEFVPDLPDVMGSMTRILRRDGVFAGTYIPRTSDTRSEVHESPDIGQVMERHYWTPDEIEGSLTSSGLAVVGREHIPAYEEGDVIVGAYNFVVAAKPPHEN